MIKSRGRTYGKVTIYKQRVGDWGRPWTDAFAEGLRKHGVQTEITNTSPEKVSHSDLHVFWGMRQTKIIEHCRKFGQPFIGLDHGYTADRLDLASINLNHLNGNSQLDVSSWTNDNSRCKSHGWEIKEPSHKLGDKIIIVGQIYNDMSLQGTDIYAWAKMRAAGLEVAGHRGDIFFKPHPKEKPEATDRKYNVGVPVFEGSMEDAFKIARLFCTYSSTVGTDAWLRGLPAVAASPVSMIFREQFNENTPDNRQKWLNGMSFRQFDLTEIGNGLVWELHKDTILEKAPGEIPTMSLVDRPEIGMGVVNFDGLAT